MKQFIKKHFGPYLIREVIPSDSKTYLGKEKVLMKYKHEGIEKEMELPLEVLKAVVTKKKLDLSELREKRVEPVVEKILIILTESELAKEDVNYAIGPKLEMSLDDAFKRASDKLWGKEIRKISLMDIHKVLLKEAFKK